MTAPAKTDDREAVRQLVRDINRAWRSGRTDDLNRYFHDDMVIVAPGFAQCCEGRAACVASYAEFVSQAKIHDYRESEPDIDFWGDTAVASVSWDIEYEMKGTVSRETGRDVFVFARESGTWRAVWRTMLLGPPQ
jgi:ketosteroid isomerase-like protein